MANRRYSSGPLGDLRVIELADEKGQWCGKLMADLGADVIKIEPPGGAAERHIGPFYQDVPHPEHSLHFWHYNTSKRGVTLDLEQSAGRDVFRRLVATADVLIETRRPGYLPALGLGFDDLRGVNPRLVMCSLTDFGQTGPWRDYQASDLVHLAAGGQMGCCGYSEEDFPDAPPIAPGGGNAWHIAGHYAYMAITSAVIFRDLTGIGQYIDTSVHGACALTTEMHVYNWIYQKQVVKRQTGQHASVQPPARTQLRCKDGKYVNTSGAFLMRMGPDQFKAVVAWMDRYGLAQDLQEPKYHEPGAIQANQEHFMAAFGHFIANITQEEAYHGAQALGFSWGAVRAPEEVLQDEHFQDRGFFVEVEHPELGTSFTYPGAAAMYAKSPWRISKRAPLIGEHNLEVLQELGITKQELALLRQAGAI